MAKIKKTKVDGALVYPATIFPAVKDPNTGQTLTDKLSELGSYVSNAEYLRAYVDESNNFLWGIKRDGSVEFGKGVPTPVKRYIDDLDLNNDVEIERINELVTGLLKEMKVLTDTYQYKDNNEWHYLISDSEGRVLLGIKKSGEIEWAKGVPTPVVDYIEKYVSKVDLENDEEVERINQLVVGLLKDVKTLTDTSYYISNTEWRLSIVDDSNKFLFGIKRDGSVDWAKGIPRPIADKIKELKTNIDSSNNNNQLLCNNGRKIIAHRGYHLSGVPENSIDSVEYAALCGFDFVETDFSTTSDGILVLMHDSTINRTMRLKNSYEPLSEDIVVSEHTYAELSENYVLASENVSMRKPIPTLEEFLVACRNNGIEPLIEIKSSGITNEILNEAYEISCRILGKDKFGFASFSASNLDYIRSLSDDVKLFYLDTPILGSVNSITGESREKPNNIWTPYYSGLKAETIKNYHNKGLSVASYTIPVSQFSNLFDVGVDYMVVDNVSPSVSGLYGVAANSRNDFKDFEHEGSVVDGQLLLKNGNKLTYNAGHKYIGGYYIKIILESGRLNIEAPNMSVTTSEDKNKYVFQGLVTDTESYITITAVGDAVVNSINFYSVIFQ